jgi:signal transduction histidine kinase
MISKNSKIPSLKQRQPLSAPSELHMNLFKSIFDFDENYRAEKLIRLLDIFHEMFLLVSSDYSILYANAEAIKKMKLDNFHNYKLNEVVKLDLNSSKSVFDNFKETDSFYNFESYLINSPEVPVNCDVSFFDLTSGPKISFWIIQDISDYKRIENSLEKTDKKYKKILQGSSDVVLILNHNLIIEEINQAGLKLLGFGEEISKSISFLSLIDDENAKLIQDTCNKKGKLTNYSLKLKNDVLDEETLVLLNFRNIPNENEYIVFMKDVSDELNIHQLMLRTVVDTQEKERQRFARDIHDDLGQQLSALKFNLSALRSYIPNEQARELLIESENILIEANTSVRDICFDLMPKSLEKNGLIITIEEFIRKMEAMNHVEIRLVVEDVFPVLSDEKNVAFYRIIQEFINNSIKHGNSNKIQISFQTMKNFVIMHLSDDGKGFDIQNLNRKNGNGMENIDSRAKAYNGVAQFNSKLGLGTSCEIKIPIK